MRSVIIYGTTVKPSHRSLVRWHYRTVRLGKKTIYLRVEESDKDYTAALDRAVPLAGETVLNSMEL